MRQSEKYWMKVLVLALCLCLSYATYTFHIVSRSGFRVFVLVDNCFSTFFFLLPYQNFACPVLKSRIHNEVELKI